MPPWECIYVKCNLIVKSRIQMNCFSDGEMLFQHFQAFLCDFFGCKMSSVLLLSYLFNKSELQWKLSA